MALTATVSPQKGLIGEITVVDEVTPEISQAVATIPMAIRTSLLSYGASIKTGVRNSFRAAQIKGPFNKDVTLKIKGYKPVLNETGALENSVMDTGGIEPVESGGEYAVRLTWDFPSAGIGGIRGENRKNKSFTYLLVHEYGNRTGIPQVAVEVGDNVFTLKPRMWNMPKRPFLQAGLSSGMVSGTPIAVATLLPALGIPKTPPIIMVGGKVVKMRKAAPLELERGFRYKPFGVPLTPSLYPTSASGMGWYFVPPSKGYAVIGAVSDLMGAWKGSFNEKSIVGYLRQYAWGTTGVTKKATRRRFRRRLWGRE